MSSDAVHPRSALRSGLRHSGSLAPGDAKGLLEDVLRTGVVGDHLRDEVTKWTLKLFDNSPEVVWC
jgi:hypothetical protein